MSFEPDIQFIKTSKPAQLEKFVQEIKSLKGGCVWRCLYAALDPEIVKNQGRKNIAAAFLASSFRKNTYEIKVFWLTSGHLFIFFQGLVRAVIRDYESFLEFIGEGQKPDYHFFWELNEFWGYFDQILISMAEQTTSGDSKAVKDESPKSKLPNINDLYRQRAARYRPLLLIVEDDRTTRHLLQASMEKYCDIAVAWTASQARELYETMLPNIAFLDIELPDGDGQELAELFCGHDSDSFIAMVSGALDSNRIDRCLRAGAKGCISKPASEHQLLSLVDQYRKLRQKKQALGGF